MNQQEEQELREFIKKSLEQNIRPMWSDLSQEMSDALVAAYKIGFEDGLLKGYHQAGLIIEDAKNQN